VSTTASSVVGTSAIPTTSTTKLWRFGGSIARNRWSDVRVRDRLTALLGRRDRQLVDFTVIGALFAELDRYSQRPTEPAACMLAVLSVTERCQLVGSCVPVFQIFARIVVAPSRSLPVGG